MIKCKRKFDKNKDVTNMNSENSIAPINEDLNVAKYDTDSIKNLINPYNLTLTSDKDSISGADYESATVTATLTDKKTGLPVQDELLIYTIHDSDYNLLDDGLLTTDVDGNASVVYTAVGAGDVYVTFSLRTVLQETFVIDDCLKYWETLSINGDTIVDYTLPSEFEIDFTIYSTVLTSNTSLGYLRFNNASGVFVGKAASLQTNIYFFDTIISQITQTNTDYNFVLTYRNGITTLTDGTNTYTSTQSLDKLYSLVSNGGTRLKNIKLKAL